MARERVAEATGTFFFPLDLPCVVRKVIRRLRPDLFIIAETELWPNFLRIVKEEGAKTLLVNGRISDRSFNRYRKTRFFWTAVLDNFDAMSMIRVQDGERIISMGANPVKVFVNGNCKFDQAAALRRPGLPGRDEEDSSGSERRSRSSSPGPPTRGKKRRSSRPFRRFAQRYPETILILVPRHVDRSARVEKLLERHGIRGSNPPKPARTGRGGKGRGWCSGTPSASSLKFTAWARSFSAGRAWFPSAGRTSWSRRPGGKSSSTALPWRIFSTLTGSCPRVGAGIMVRNGEELADRCLYLLDHPRELGGEGKGGEGSPSGPAWARPREIWTWPESCCNDEQRRKRFWPWKTGKFSKAGHSARRGNGRVRWSLTPP